jgi:hypothetical protein
MTDDCDDSILFEVQDGHVFIGFTLDGGDVAAQMKLSPAKQEEFAQLYVAACHQAKVNAEAAGRPVKHGNHGPGCRCTPCVAEPGYRQVSG